MYASVTRDTDPTIAAAATLILALTTLVTVAATIFMSRRTRVR
jgi:putative spermidine/putrescine transport system permease protein